MTEKSILRRAIDANWYEGPIHVPEPDEDYDHLRDGIALAFTDMRTDVISLKNVRDPEGPRLDDLEDEYGQVNTENLSVEDRIKLLKPKRYRRATTGNVSDLQTLLDSGGYDLTVYNNSPDGPPIDPAVLLAQNFQMQAAEGTNYYAGNTLAYAGKLGGYILANGDTGNQTPGILGAGQIYAGNTNANAGYFDNYVNLTIDYQIPTDPEDWCFMPIIGGDATFDPFTGQILSVEQGLVPSAQQRQLETLVLGFKGMYTWVQMIVTYT